MTKRSNESLQAELEALVPLDRAELAVRWTKAFGCPAPRKCGATLLRSALSWQLQMRAQAGRAGGKRALQFPKSGITAGTSLSLLPGTRLLREWQGRTHHVTVMPGGFEYDGKRYRSLTAIARQITGTPWSGPLFFGLRR